ncbi:winged helix-turn-helix transcriptional regulator [Serratia fonticola]|uniref:winged helix-turn-helix domain-containing protein n=1 Tax=Serratia fonticola TaxID=47917 RepID=UPI0015C68BAA|nr:winged helix-turn-helix domain-containing protein [Serratia fonticola]MBC3377669.1 winged helix-turn-helix transcriptional regulator [Serratia fonticola]NYA36869.1 winged helix-turn-helix transcriptional regulator [Serratia fonticola]
MKYTINLIVVFDPDHRTLALNNNNQTTIELSKPSCRVLNEFIKNNGENLSRDALLRNAWEDYGFSPSNASLNNCVSDLRKSFVSLGIEKPIIITLPRLGFRMEAEIHPTPKQTVDTKINKEEAVATKPEKVATLKQDETITPLPLVMPDRLIKKSMLIPIMALMTVLAIIGLALLLSAPSNQFKLIGTYKQCDIYSIRKDPVPGSEFRAKKMLETEKLDCELVRQDIFYTEERPDNDLFKRTFLAACKKNQTGSDYQYCKTFKINE